MAHKNWTDYTKTEMQKLPRRPWDIEKTYEWLCLVNTRQKHDSGYNFFIVVGFNADGSAEIAAQCDDFMTYGFLENILSQGNLSIDCSMHGIFRFHSNRYRFTIGHSLSTTDWTVVERKQG